MPAAMTRLLRLTSMKLPECADGSMSTYDLLLLVARLCHDMPRLCRLEVRHRLSDSSRQPSRGAGEVGDLGNALMPSSFATRCRKSMASVSLLSRMKTVNDMHEK